MCKIPRDFGWMVMFPDLLSAEHARTSRGITVRVQITGSYGVQGRSERPSVAADIVTGTCLEEGPALNTIGPVLSPRFRVLPRPKGRTSALSMRTYLAIARV